MSSAYEIVKNEVIAQLSFLRFNRMTVKRIFKGEEDNLAEYSWECVSRVKAEPVEVHNTDSGNQNFTSLQSLDAVEIHATLIQEMNEYLVLILQYRPPVNTWVVEFPGGLIDLNESASEAAIRELFEETGYIIKSCDIYSISEPLCLEPSITNECEVLVSVTIKSDKFDNANPKPLLQDAEDIEVILVPLATSSLISTFPADDEVEVEPLQFVLDKVQKLRQENRNVIIDAKVYTHLLGMRESTLQLKQA